MATIHLVSHTHWDREWYLTFQQFRLKLVHMIDILLDILDNDPGFRCFMLDGQTIVLDDYLEIRPEMFSAIQKHVQNGRLLIGPWHILPDEFLVSPEATIRNLLQGDRTARQFGQKMNIGYIPDPFGHIGQMPQILSGFRFKSACVQRGLSDEPCEFWWQAPDGSRVFMAYLRDGYGNAAYLPTSSPERFLVEVRRLMDSLSPYTTANHLLLMHGTDHMNPQPDTSQAIIQTNNHLDGDTLTHSSLLEYIKAVQYEIAAQNINLPTIVGELRSPKRHHLLPGVLSTRIWIKQRNHTCETLLEKWAEPFSTWASLIADKHNSVAADLTKTREGQFPRPKEKEVFHFTYRDHLSKPGPILRQIWRLLMECHPHDSICGCSIDQVHEEMRPRYDQVEQVGEEITRQSLDRIAEAIDTRPTGHVAVSNYFNSEPDHRLPVIVVFNPCTAARTDLATVEIELPPNLRNYVIVDEMGEISPHHIIGEKNGDLFSATLDRTGMRAALSIVREGRIGGMVMHQLDIRRDGDQAFIEAILAESGEPNLEAWTRGMHEIETLLKDSTLNSYVVRAFSIPSTRIVFLARYVPGHGYRTFWVRAHPLQTPIQQKPGFRDRLIGLFMPLVVFLARRPIFDKMLTALSLAKDKRPLPLKPPLKIENQFISVQVSPKTGTLTVLDKRTGVVYIGLNRFIDGGDRGDEYNYCPPAKDELIHNAKVLRIRESRNSVLQTVEIRLFLRLPQELAPDHQSRSRKKVVLPVKTTISLANGVPRLDIRTEVDNRQAQVKDHRLRVHFPANLNLTHADYDGHFEVVRRPIDLPAYDDTWIEQPRSEVPQRAFTTISNGTVGLTIANRGLPEVAVLRDPEGSCEIALTLLRCVGWLSRDDLSTRKGHAGPQIATPGAQMPEKYTFDYSLIPHTGGWKNSFQEAYAYTSPFRTVSSDVHPGDLPPRQSFVEVSPDKFVISAIKAAEDGSGWILRGYNISEENIAVTLKSWPRFSHAAQVDLSEEILHDLPVDQQGAIVINARRHEILTIKFN